MARGTRGGAAGAGGALAPAPHSPDRPRRLPRTGREPESGSGSGRAGRPIAPRAPNFPPIAAALSRWADRQGPGRRRGRGSADEEFCVTSSRHHYSTPAFSLALHAVLLGPLSSRPSAAVVPTGTSGVGGASSGGLSPSTVPGPASPISPQPGPGDFPHDRWVTPGCGLRLGEEAGARTALAPESGPGRLGQAGAGPTLLEETRSQCHCGGQGRRRGGWRSAGDCRDGQIKGRTADNLGKGLTVWTQRTGPKEPGETLGLDYRGLRPILRTAASVLDHLGSLRALADKDPLLSLGVRSPRPSLLLPWARSPP